MSNWNTKGEKSQCWLIYDERKLLPEYLPGYLDSKPLIMKEALSKFSHSRAKTHLYVNEMYIYSIAPSMMPILPHENT